MHIVDRRLNPKGKNLPNRQRFLRRARDVVRQAVRDASARRSIKDAGEGGEVVIPAGGVREPEFRRAGGSGRREYVLPGNRSYTAGDKIEKPRQGGGRGSDASDDSDGEDAFRFALSREEFLDLFLEDLELPDLAKQKLKELEQPAWRRAGYVSSGSPANLSLSRTMRNSLTRRIALGRPRPLETLQLEEELAVARADGDAAEVERLEARLAGLRRRLAAIPWIDPIDVRYRRFEPVPRPAAQAVMFCLMDVSGSMTEHMKDLGKRFFMLLYLFLSRNYEAVEVVFIRHTHKAEEVDEQTFFYSPETGGTVVSTALAETVRVVEDRYPADDWNIYVAQVSDGDNISTDSERTARLLEAEVLPLCQYFAYLEVGADDDGFESFRERTTPLWRTYAAAQARGAPLAMRKVSSRTEIYPVFRQLFERNRDLKAAAP